MDEKQLKIHNKSMEIVKMLIDSELSISDQIKVINNVRERLLFCKTTGQELNQIKLKLKIMDKVLCII